MVPKDCCRDALNEVGQSALSLHGDLEQRDRDQTWHVLLTVAPVLVATDDAAARGLDIKSLELGGNFELARDQFMYIASAVHFLCRK
ncbi:MAG: helicase-related protein [Escherichia coli]